MSKRRSANHVTLGNGGRMQCNHCGMTYTPAYPSPINVLVAATEAFSDLHAKCEKPKDPLCEVCLQPGHTFDRCVELNVQTPADWMNLGDTGTSSIAIWRHMQGMQPEWLWGPDPPRDPSDFGRCYRLLKKFPEWKDRLEEMRCYRGWTPFVVAWDKLEALYIEEFPTGKAPRLWAEMKRLSGV